MVVAVIGLWPRSCTGGTSSARASERRGVPRAPQRRRARRRGRPGLRHLVRQGRLQRQGHHLPGHRAACSSAGYSPPGGEGRRPRPRSHTVLPAAVRPGAARPRDRHRLAAGCSASPGAAPVPLSPPRPGHPRHGSAAGTTGRPERRAEVGSAAPCDVAPDLPRRRRCSLGEDRPRRNAGRARLPARPAVTTAPGREVTMTSPRAPRLCLRRPARQQATEEDQTCRAESPRR